MKTPASPHILMLVDDTLSKQRRTGVQRVVVETARALALRTDFDLVRWDLLEGRLRFLDQAELDQLFGPGGWPSGIRLRVEGRQIGRPFRECLECPENTWLLIPEVSWHSENGTETMARAIAHCRDWGGRSAAIFYDLIPVKNPAYSAHKAEHEAYLAQLIHTDLIIPISATAGDELARLWRDRGIAPHPAIAPLLLPDSGFFGVRAPSASPSRQIALLGTIEPRKRQVEFLCAMEAARQRSRETALWSVVVIGSVHHSVASNFNALVKRNDWLTHRDYVFDKELDNLIAQSAFTVFASDDEGYGLPISESLASGVPCLCANFGSMAEIAAGGGCETVDVRDPTLLAEAIVQLCESPERLAVLRTEIAARHFTSWADYGGRLAQILSAHTASEADLAPIILSFGRTENLDADAIAGADLLTFKDDQDRLQFIKRARSQSVSSLLPAAVIEHEAPAVASALAREKTARARLASTEAAFAVARQALGPRDPTRKTFLRVLISTYNRSDFVVANVRWLLKKVLTDPPLLVDLVVVDGGSTDGTIEGLRQIYDPRLQVVECPTNVGMLAGIREAARLPGAEYVWLVGDDDFIDPASFAAMVDALRTHAGIPFAVTNFAVYHRAALSPADMVQRLILEGRAVADNVEPSGLLPVHEIAAQTDNLFTAIYTIVWRADLLSAAYEHNFDGPPFHDLIQAIPCTDFILRRYGDCKAYWHAGVGITGNAHNSWSHHRPRWHGVVMPLALALAREAGVNPFKLQSWADLHLKLLNEARGLADNPNEIVVFGSEHAALAHRVFRTLPPGFAVA